MRKQLYTCIIILLGLTIIGCGDNDPSRSKKTVAEEENLLETAKTDLNQTENTICADLVKTLGVKEAFLICVEQAEAGNMHANATLGVLYAQGLLGGVDWPKANHWFLQAARLGHPESQFHISQSFELGRGIEKNPQQAHSWLLKSAEANFSLAQAHLGHKETDPNIKKFWLTKSAANDNPLGMYYFAQLFLEGLTVAKDNNQAEKLLLSAAQKGEPLAMLQLGDLYRTGTFSRNPEKVNYWYLQALETHSNEAQYHIGQLLLNQQWTLPAVNPILLIQQAANEGHAKAQLMLARLYHYGDKVPKDEVQAFQWYLSASEQNESEALYQVGMSYITGSLGQRKELDKGLYYLKQSKDLHFLPAIELLDQISQQAGTPIPENFQAVGAIHKSARAGSLESQIKLAKLLMSYGVPRYDVAGFHWATKAAVTQQPEAQLLLADCYANGIGTPVNDEKAFIIYLALADQMVPLAQYKVGKMYFEGQGTPKDTDLAKKWILAAVRSNIQEAKEYALAIFQEESALKDSNENMEWLDFAAENGHPKALYMKGMDYLYGGILSNNQIQKGLQMLEQAGEKQFPLACRELGNIYMQGLFGYHENLQKAHTNFLKAAKLGDEYSQFRVAHMYYYGIGVERNYIHSYVWADMTAQKGHTEGILLRDELATLLNADEIRQAQLLAQKYMMSERN